MKIMEFMLDTICNGGMMKFFMTNAKLNNLNACPEARNVLNEIIQGRDIEVTVQNCQLFLDEFERALIDYTSVDLFGQVAILNHWDSVCHWLTSWIYELTDVIKDRISFTSYFRNYLVNKPDWKDTYVTLRNLANEKRAALLCDLLVDNLKESKE
jgi:hypothetical protein